MLKFPTMFDKLARVHCNSGNPFKKVYKPVVGSDGVLDLVESGEESLYDYIQSWKDSVDINVILARYANGDVDVLSKMQGAYGDFTQFPKTYAEMLNRVIQGKEFFYSLPLDIREKYNNNFTEFISAMDKPDFWNQFMPADDVNSENQPADGKDGIVSES